MRLQTTHIMYKDEQIRHSYLCSYLPLTTTTDPLSRSLLKFKRGRQPDLANWIRATLEGYSHYPLSPDTIILRALRHNETEIPQSTQTQQPTEPQFQQSTEPQTQQSTEPQTQQPTEPQFQQSTEPQTQQPTESQFQQSTEPQTQQPTEPQSPQKPPSPSLFPLPAIKPTPLDLLGQNLSNTFNCQYLPSLLRKSKPTLSNKGLTRENRETQLQNIYSIPHPPPDQHPILLIDDIFTTGATARAIIQAIRHSSANTPIEVFTLAKATYPRNPSFR